MVSFPETHIDPIQLKLHCRCRLMANKLQGVYDCILSHLKISASIKLVHSLNSSSCVHRLLSAVSTTIVGGLLS